jgi:hypothetical protein
MIDLGLRLTSQFGFYWLTMENDERRGELACDYYSRNCNDRLSCQFFEVQSSNDMLWGLLSLLYNGYLVIPGGTAAGAWR